MSKTVGQLQVGDNVPCRYRRLSDRYAVSIGGQVYVTRWHIRSRKGWLEILSNETFGRQVSRSELLLETRLRR